MNKLSELLASTGIRKAVIIDDVFDDVPSPDDLSADAWSIFFDDLGLDERKLLADLFPAYEETHPDELQASQEFIAVVWANRTDLPSAACNQLFGDYKARNDAERGDLEALVSTLEELGLTCATVGRQFDEEAYDADLILVDLFLGFQQSEGDMDRAIRRIKEFVKDRTEDPPLVILMSRSTRLQENRNEFRDEAGLLGSTFRVASKAELKRSGTLETLLTRLASHYDDAKRVAGFVHAWDRGLDQARESFVRILRRLDLSDLAQIRSLLLDFEGQYLGEYLLDVADRVLQHEIEADPGTISATRELNKVNFDKYPAPHLSGSADLQDLVHRMVFQHIERLNTSNDEDPPQVRFGDVLRLTDEETVTDKVYLVVTPACDLARDPADNILVVPGILRPLAVGDWSYGPSEVKTPIFVHSDGKRFWIKWDLKGRRTLSFATLHKQQSEEYSYDRLGRIREIYTLEIQQRLLADMGRIGQPANPPATFQVSIIPYRVAPDARLHEINIPELSEAVCFVGRGERPNRVDHLVLTDQACDALRNKVQQLPLDDVHAAAKPSLTAMKEDYEFFERFRLGSIDVPWKKDSPRPERSKDNLIYMHFVRNEWAKETDPVTGDYRKGPLILKICDVIPSY